MKSGDSDLMQDDVFVLAVTLRCGMSFASLRKTFTAFSGTCDNVPRTLLKFPHIPYWLLVVTVHR